MTHLLIRAVQAGGYVVSKDDNGRMGALPSTEFAFTDIDDLMRQIRSIIVTGDVMQPAQPIVTIRNPPMPASLEPDVRGYPTE